MNWKEIKVTCVQHSIPDRAALLEHIRSLPGCEKHALPDDATDMELIPAYAAKRCYMSFEPGVNPNVTRVRRSLADFFNNILSSGHGSVLEHSSWTFAIDGVTRVFTGEMNRHRAGVAVSEGSMRFILQRIDDGIDVWLPRSMLSVDTDSNDIINKKKATLAIFEDIFSKVEKSYKKLVDLWQVSTLSNYDKKIITSLLRRILPMGCCTGGFWTMNIRAMRHIIATRTSEAAEEEIAYVFDLIAEEMVHREPRLFGDFHKSISAWIPEHPKV